MELFKMQQQQTSFLFDLMELDIQVSIHNNKTEPIQIKFNVAGIDSLC